MFSEAELLARVNEPGLFNTASGITILSARSDGTAEGVLAVGETNLNPHGTVHGGCLYTLADTVAGTAVAAACGKPCVTANSSMEFLRPATGSRVFCSVRPKKLGRVLCVMAVELTGESGKAVATGTFTFAVTG